MAREMAAAPLSGVLGVAAAVAALVGVALGVVAAVAAGLGVGVAGDAATVRGRPEGDTCDSCKCMKVEWGRGKRGRGAGQRGGRTICDQKVITSCANACWARALSASHVLNAALASTATQHRKTSARGPKGLSTISRFLF